VGKGDSTIEATWDIECIREVFVVAGYRDHVVIAAQDGEPAVQTAAGDAGPLPQPSVGRHRVRCMFGRVVVEQPIV
jgi:hypothetical protein